MTFEYKVLPPHSDPVIEAMLNATEARVMLRNHPELDDISKDMLETLAKMQVSEDLINKRFK